MTEPVRRICLFGGSFDPVHEGHLTIASAAREACALDEVIFLPAACSPFKQGKQHFLTDEERMELLQLATAEQPWARVSDLDLTLPPPSWSWRLAAHFRELYPRAELYWLLGTDQWEQLHRWARYDYLLEQLCFIVYHRGTEPQLREGARSVFLSGDHPASSSRIRSCLEEGLPLPASWLHPAVAGRLTEIAAARRMGPSHVTNE